MLSSWLLKRLKISTFPSFHDIEHFEKLGGAPQLFLFSEVHLDKGGYGDPNSFAKIWSWLVNEVPAPPPGTALVLHGLSEPLCVASRPPAAGLPAVYVPLQHLLTRLSVSSILLVTRLVLLEQKVLFVGSSVAMLTSACEAFSTILFFPLAWVHCYNPLLPSTDYLQTPPPFLFGCLREIILKETFADSHDLMSCDLLSQSGLADRDFSIVDLDTGAWDRKLFAFHSPTKQSFEAYP